MFGSHFDSLLATSLDLHVRVRRADHVLGDQESPLTAKLLWKGSTEHAQFHLRRRANGMVRVYAQLSEGYETFHNIIVQPHASTRAVVRQLVDKYFRKWNPHQLEVVEVTPQAGGCVLLHCTFQPTPQTMHGHCGGCSGAGGVTCCPSRSSTERVLSPTEEPLRVQAEWKSPQCKFELRAMLPQPKVNWNC